MVKTAPRHDGSVRSLKAVSPGAADDGLIITGGYGGTQARLEDLEYCAKALDSAATSLGYAWTALTGMQGTLDGWSALPLRPTPEQSSAVAAAQRARIELEPIRSSPHGTRALADELLDLARQVRSARAEYEESESFTTKYFNSLWDGVMTGLTLSDLGPLFMLAGLGVVLPREALLVLMGRPIPGDRAQRYVGVLANAINAMRPGPQLPLQDPVPAAAGFFSLFARLVVPRAEVVALPVLGGYKVRTPPRGVEDLVTRFRDLTLNEPACSDYGDGVLVEKIHHLDGTTSWSVTIPGTQVAGFGNDQHPFNNLSNLEAEAGVVADSTRAVLAAMEAAGVPVDEPVMLTGHSQGGLVAQQIAAMGTHAVAAVLTIGSPTGTRTMRSTVPTVHVEHPSELISALDANANRDDPLTTTVRLDPVGTAARNPSEAHATGTYEETAALIDESDHPSVVKWRESVREVFGDGGTSESRLYSVHRRETAF